jgi:hypothetical protein
MDSVWLVSLYAVSVLCVSVKYWENFIHMGNEKSKLLPRIKFEYQRGRTKVTCIANLWKITLTFIAVIAIFAIRTTTDTHSTDTAYKETNQTLSMYIQITKIPASCRISPSRGKTTEALEESLHKSSNLWKITLTFIAVIVIFAIRTTDFTAGFKSLLGNGSSMLRTAFGERVLGDDLTCQMKIPFIVAIVNILCEYLCYKAAKTSCVIYSQKPCIITQKQLLTTYIFLLILQFHSLSTILRRVNHRNQT